MRTVHNPFRPTRWEHHSDGSPLIWFTPTAALLSEDKSAYLFGSRGSGKTTLLRSICWEDLVHNESLRLQKKLTDFRHIGVYVRFPDHVSGSMSFLYWQKLFPTAPNPELEFFGFFSLAVELICLEKLLETVHELRLRNLVKLDAGAELQFVENLLAEFPNINRFSDRQPITLLDLSRTFRNLVRRMNEASGRGTLYDILSSLPSRDANELLQWAAEQLSRQITFTAAANQNPLGFKFCLDDCEVLNQLQRTTVNTLVRKSRFPISWVVSSVAIGTEASSTFINEQPLTDADRRVISLNSRNENEFKELCESVASLRVYFSLPEHARPQLDGRELRQVFPLLEKFGHRTVNEIIHVILRRSTSPEVELIFEGARRLRALLNHPNNIRSRYLNNNPDRLPFYEAYILMLWGGGADAFSTKITASSLQKIPRFVHRLSEASFQAWMRRKMLAALLHIAGRLGFKRLSLAGENIITTLADGSIRDFLEIMAEIYEVFTSFYFRRSNDNAEIALRRFSSRTRIGTAIQTNGIYSSSDAFYDGISTQTDVNREAVLRIVEALGRITSNLQTNPDDPTVLGRAERGIFIIDTTHPHLTSTKAISRDRDFVFETLKQAELAGYLRPVRFSSRTGNITFASVGSDQRIVAYRLHKRLAPHFRFSYRGAYEPVQLNCDILAELCRATTASAFDSLVQTLLQQSEGTDTQLLLPLSFENETN